MRRMVAIAIGVIGASGAWAAGPGFAGFGDMAARSDVIEVRRPMWRDGTFRVGNAVGKLRRRAKASWKTQDTAAGERSLIDRYGSTSFTVTGADVRGTLSGECSYGQREDRLTIDDYSEAEPVGPLRMRCDFHRDGQPIGYLELGAMPPRGGLIELKERVGIVNVGGVRLRLRSSHQLDGTRIPVDTPLGYWIEGADGRPVGAVDVNGNTRARLALPRVAAQRDAALAAGVAIAAFWDPSTFED